MNILQYNVLDGCRTGDRYRQLSSFLTGQDYDVVGFNELNDWTATEFKEEMNKLGYLHTCLFEMESSPFNLGIIAKFPITKINAIEKSPFHHGMLHVKISTINFIVTHLTPFESEHREREAEQIAEYIQTIKEPLVVMGDFNTLSPIDQDSYDAEKLSSSKFHRRQHIVDESINYRPMQILLEAGLHDVNVSKLLDYSMPTRIRGDLINPVYVRIDYVLVNSFLLDNNPIVSILRNSNVSKISDHYPVQCRLNDCPK
ncbi:hypothetical protein F3157_01605 [Virgibacillus dakarensis]|nr:hypothetical protein [Virgibacillus dakarensis]